MKLHEVAWLGTFLVAGLAVRLYFFGGTFGSDDLYHVQHAHHLLHGGSLPYEQMSRSESFCYRRMGVNLPLAVVIWLCGTHEWALALVPLSASLLEIALVFVVLRRLAGTTTGLLGAGLCAFLPVDVCFATVWLQDSLFACAFVALLLCLVMSAEGKRGRWAWALSAGLTIAYLQILKESAFLLLVPALLWGAWEAWRTRRMGWEPVLVLSGFVLGQLLVGVLFLRLQGDLFFYVRETYRAVFELETEIPAQVSRPEILDILRSMLFQNWLFGFAIALLPATAVLTFLDRRVRYRLLLGLLCVAQIFVLSEAMRWTPQQRYLLQVSVLFVLVTALGIGFVVRRLPAGWCGPGTAAALVGLSATGALALDRNRQQCSSLRIEPIRRAYSYLSDCLADDEVIYVRSARARGGRTQRVVYQLNGFAEPKGGFADLRDANAERSGWVLVSYLDERYANRGRPIRVRDNWLEVYRWRRGGCWARVFRILPDPVEHQSSVLAPFGGGERFLPLPEIAAAHFTPIVFDQPAGAYRSRWCGSLDSVTLTNQDGALHFGIVVPADTKYGVYGGVRFDAPRPRAIRFTVAFRNPENIKAVFVEGHTDTNSRAARWEWRSRGTVRPAAKPETFVLVHDEPAGFFRPVDDARPDLIAGVDIFIQVAPGREAGFILRDVAVVLPESLSAEQPGQERLPTP